MDDEAETEQNLHPLPDRVHGFYRTAEGRKFLRFAYDRYFDLVKRRREDFAFGDLKIASMIADQALDQDAENRLTRAALKRWAEQGQSEIWHKDARKTLRVMARLEEQMMLEPEIAEICDDRAATLRKMDTANALSFFFYGEKPSSTSKVINRELEKHEGVFEVKFGRSRNDDRSAPESVIYWKVSRAETHPFLLFQEFAFPKTNLFPRLVFSSRCAGFLFVREGKKLVRFAVDHTDHQSRWIDIYDPVPDRLRQVSFQFEELFPDDKCYSVRTSERSDTVYKSSNLTLDFLVLRRAAPDVEELVNQYFSGTMWDIPV